MDPSHSLRLKQLFNRYIEMPAEQRQARMDADPELDDTLRQRLRELFDADANVANMTVRSAMSVATAAVAPSANWVGRRVGAFVIQRELGSGGMGVVYHATRADGEVAQDAAIKVLRSSVMDVAARERFQRERELLARFSHPHIARLFDAGVTDDGSPYFVMEYLRGASITRYCDEQRLGIESRLRLFLKVCDAVLYAHRQLVLHRDIKPSNVLIDEHGEPKLIDFGIAKPLLMDAEVAATLTHQRFFSPLNAAPEQLQGDAMGVACDVYQLGALLYELLCGRPIFDLEGKSPGAIEEVIREQMPVPPSARNAADDLAQAQARHCSDVRALRRQLHGDLDAIALCALRKDPARRYAAVEQFAEDVSRFLERRPVHGRRGSIRYRVSLYMRRNWRAIGLAAMVFASFCVFVWIVIGERNKAIVERGRAEAVTQFLIDMFRSAEPTATTSPDMPVRAALQRGESMIDQNTSLDPATRVKLLGTLGLINMSLSDLSAAAALTDKAVALARDPRVDRRLLADTLRYASMLNYNTEKGAPYGPLASEAVAIYGALGVKDEEYYMSRLMALRWQYKTDKVGACAGVEQLLREVRSDKPKLQRSMHLFEFVTVGKSAGFMTLSAALRDAVRCRDKSPETLTRTEGELRETIAEFSARVGPDDADLQRLQVRQGRVLRELHRYDEAVAILQPLLKRQLEIFGEHSWDVAYTLSVLGGIAFDRQRYDEAEGYLLRAHDQYARMYKGGPNSDYAASAFVLARLYELSGKDLAKAAQYYEAALQAASPMEGPIEIEIGRYSAYYGAMLKHEGKSARAQELLHTAATNLPPTHADGLRARLDLAEVLLDREEREQALKWLQEAEQGVAAQPDATVAAQLAKLKVRVGPMP